MVESPNDILRVANIDVNCTLNDFEVHPNGQSSFIAYYGKNPYPVDAGKTRLLPRVIAEHFAKHLADHLLTMEEKPVSSQRERALLIKQILLGTEESYSGGTEPTEDEKVAAEVAKLEGQEVPQTPIVPEETPEPEPVAALTQEIKDNKPGDRTIPNPTLRELKEEADQLGIPYKKTVTVDQLLTMIKSF